MNKYKGTFVTVAAALGLLAIGTACANPVTFFGQDQNPGTSTTNSDSAHSQFMSHLASGVGTENFEGIAANTTAPLTINFQGSSGSITANLTGDGYVSGVGDVGAFATSGTHFYDNAFGDFSLAFSSPISAFGFYGTDISDSGSVLTLTLTDSSGTTSQLDVTNNTNSLSGNELFFGFIDIGTSYTNITFNASASSDLFGFDDMTIGDLGQVTTNPNAVPEPAGLAMFGLGLLGMCLLLLYRRWDWQHD